jgi:hypothetical protein
LKTGKLNCGELRLRTGRVSRRQEKKWELRIRTGIMSRRQVGEAWQSKL